MKEVAIISHPVGEPKPYHDFLLAMEANRILIAENEKLRQAINAAKQYFNADSAEELIRAHSEFLAAVNEVNHVI